MFTTNMPIGDAITCATPMNRVNTLKATSASSLDVFSRIYRTAAFNKYPLIKVNIPKIREYCQSCVNTTGRWLLGWALHSHIEGTNINVKISDTTHNTLSGIFQGKYDDVALPSNNQISDKRKVITGLKKLLLQTVTLLSSETTNEVTEVWVAAVPNPNTKNKNILSQIFMKMLFIVCLDICLFSLFFSGNVSKQYLKNSVFEA